MPDVSQKPLSPLAQKVYDQLGQEGICGPCLIDTASTYPETPEDGFLSEFELDIRDRGVTFGVAYGIARGEDAFESKERVLARALAAAEEAYAKFGDGERVFTLKDFKHARAEAVAA